MPTSNVTRVTLDAVDIQDAVFDTCSNRRLCQTNSEGLFRGCHGTLFVLWCSCIFVMGGMPRAA